MGKCRLPVGGQLSLSSIVLVVVVVVVVVLVIGQ
jgi:hypothetical protein